MKKTILYYSIFTLLASVVVHAETTSTNKPARDLTIAKKGQWIKLFDGKTLDNWIPLEKTDYNMDSRAEVTNSYIRLAKGVPYSAIIIDAKFPKTNYEIKLRAQRLERDDIFCGILFPVKDSYCSAVFGGWGNWIVGLSCVDEMFADENSAGDTMHFTNNEWYEIRMRVTDKAITAWVHDTQVIHQDLEDHRISPYPGLEMFGPFAFFTYDTAAAYDSIEFRRL